MTASLVNFIPCNPTKGNHIQVFISIEGKLTLDNLIFNLGNYNQVTFILS